MYKTEKTLSKVDELVYQTRDLFNITLCEIYYYLFNSKSVVYLTVDDHANL